MLVNIFKQNIFGCSSDLKYMTNDRLYLHAVLNVEILISDSIDLR